MSALYFDSHNHLQDEKFRDDLDALIQDCSKRGIKRFCVAAARPSDWEKVARLARFYSEILPAFGIHPWFYREAEKGWQEKLRSLLLDFPQAAIGEAGLDDWKKPFNAQKQEEVFLVQLNMAKELKRTLVVHILKSWQRFFPLIKKAGYPQSPLLFHAFNGGLQEAISLKEKNAYFSFGCPLIQAPEKLKEIVRHLPKERICLESDAPDMLPKKPGPCQYLENKGEKLNLPQNIILAAKALAQILGEEGAIISQMCYQNTQRCFQL